MRVLLDTNVVSVLKSDARESQIAQKIARLIPSDTFLSSITVGELWYGVHLMPDGRRCRDLKEWLVNLEREFDGRILPVDGDVGRIFGLVMAENKRQGLNLQISDGLIAASAIHHGLHVMTRNIKHFESTGALVINPWDS